MLFPLARLEAIDGIMVTSRQKASAESAIMDVASATVEGARKLVYDGGEGLSNADVVVITAGINQKGKTPAQTHAGNLEIARDVFKKGTLKSSAIVVCLATPVDDITAQVQRECGLPVRQVLGFGGDLDTNRLRYILQRRGIPHEYAHAVGEHGGHAVPIYQDEVDYQDVTAELRGFWGKLAAGVDVVRNLATAELLGKLVESLVSDSMVRHNVCAFHQEHGVYMTWPFAIGRYGVEEPAEIHLPPKGKTGLEALIEERLRRLAAPVQ